MSGSVPEQSLLLRRIAVGIPVLGLVCLAAILLYSFASSTTDENLFVSTVSRVIVSRDVPARRGERLDMDRTTLMRLPDSDTSLKAGEILFGIAGRNVANLQDARRFLQGLRGDSLITVSALHAETRSAASYSVAAGQLDGEALAELPGFVIVTEVTPEGGSDRAGMHVGDLIVRINGEGFNSDLEADHVLRRAQSGKTIAYEIVRDGRPLTLHVLLAEYGLPLWVIVVSFAGFLYFGIGTFLLLKRPNLKAALLLGFSFVLLGFLLTGSFARPEPLSVLSVLRGVLRSACLMFGVALWLHSRAYFPRERPGMLARRWVLWSTYGLALVLTILAFIVGDKLIVAAVFVQMIYAIVVLWIFRKSVTPDYKRLDRAIWYSFMLLGAVFLGVRTVVAFTELPFDMRLLGFLLALIPLSHLYVIGRHQLLDMNLRLRRNLQYSFVSVVWGVVAAILFMGVFSAVLQLDLKIPVVIVTGSSVEVTDTPASPEVREAVRRAIAVGLGIASWYLIWRLRRRIQAVIDGKYFRMHYDYRRAGDELAEVMAKNLTMVDLGHGIVEKLTTLMQLKRSGILFFRDESVCCCQEASGIASPEWGEFCGATRDTLANAIRHFQGEIRVDDLPQDLKDHFTRHEFQYLVPVRSKEKLIGVFVLGEKRSEATYTQEDLAFLSSAAKQASVAIENAFLYEELAGQERMKHELAIARRIQLASLPQTTPDVPGLDIAGRSVPAQEVGGDFFDYLNGTPDKLTVIVGDVSGKGTSAALYMSKVQGILRSLHGFDLSPSDLFIRTNRLLCQDMEKKSFVTAFGAAFVPSTHTVVLARAGHLPLYRYDAVRHTVERVTPRGLGLGLNDSGLFSTEIEERTLSYGGGDLLVFVTDGVTEARDLQGEEFGEERLVRAVEEGSNLSATGLRDRLFAALHMFTGDQPQHDDQTIVVVRASA